MILWWRIHAKTQPSAGGFWRENAIWMSLFEATWLSLEHKTAICFA
jgi:hypothetical protein